MKKRTQNISLLNELAGQYFNLNEFKNAIKSLFPIESDFDLSDIINASIAFGQFIKVRLYCFQYFVKYIIHESVLLLE